MPMGFNNSSFLDNEMAKSEKKLMLLHFSITCELCSRRRIIQNACYTAVNHTTDLSGNKCAVSRNSKGHVPEL